MDTIVDSYSEANQDEGFELSDTHPSSGGLRSAAGQTFTGNGKKLYGCKFYLKKLGSPGNIIARLYAHTGTWGSTGEPTGAALDSSNLVAGSGIGTEYALVEFKGFSGYTLVSGTHYCIVLEAYDGTWDTDNKIYVGLDNSTPTHAGNPFTWYWDDWFYAEGSDVCFYVYSVPPVVTIKPSANMAAKMVAAGLI